MPKLPPGLELSYSLELPPTAFDAFVLSLHWSIIRCGLLAKTEGEGEGSERLPSGWYKQEGATTLSLFYLYKGTRIYELRIIELTKDDVIAVTLFHAAGGATMPPPKPVTTPREESGEPEEGSTRPVSTVVSGTVKNAAAATTFQLGQFVKLSAFEGGEDPSKRKARTVYENAEELEKAFYAQVMAPLGFTCDVQVPKGPYESKVQDEEKNKRDRSPERGESIYVIDDSTGGSNPDLDYDPLGRRFVPPPLPQLGRSDLDPLGRFGAGNLMDPRGMRGRGSGGIPPGLLPGMPGGLPPGARFDPFGPINPLRPDAGGRPNPDHARPHNFNDYDDMFM